MGCVKVHLKIRIYGAKKFNLRKYYLMIYGILGRLGIVLCWVVRKLHICIFIVGCDSYLRDQSTMTAKRHWPFSNFQDVHNKCSRDLNISWSSSNSDEDLDCNASKKQKSGHSLSANSHAKRRQLSQNSVCSDKCEPIIDNTLNESSISICTQFTCEILPSEDQYKPSSSSNHSFQESPIIGTIKFEELSPVLRWKGNNAPVIKSSSPTIGKNRMNLRTRKIFKNSNKEQLQQKSEFIHVTQQSNTIIESDSPKSSQATQYAIICSGQTSQSPSNLIDSFSSEQCTEIVFNTTSTDTLSSNSSNAEPLYYEVLPQKRKKYKKNGIAYQLQKTLHKQKTDVAICKHELYLTKLKGYVVATPYQDSLVLLLQVIRVWKEYGVTIVQCRYITDVTEVSDEHSQELKLPGKHKLLKNAPDAEHAIAQNSDDKNSISSEHCLIIIGFNVTHSIRLKENGKLKLYPPYMTKTIQYNEEFQFCYFNVSKLFYVT